MNTETNNVMEPKPQKGLSGNINLSKLQSLKHIMDSRQFEAWEYKTMEGVHRKLTFARQSLLGEISRYNLEDYIIWKYEYPQDPEYIYKKWKGNSDTFLSRFVFLHPEISRRFKRKAIYFGFRGFIDIFVYPVTAPPDKRIHKDIHDIESLLWANTINGRIDLGEPKA